MSVVGFRIAEDCWRPHCSCLALKHYILIRSTLLSDTSLYKQRIRLTKEIYRTIGYKMQEEGVTNATFLDSRYTLQSFQWFSLLQHSVFILHILIKK
jgi:hypothetical protein